jgi:hypothetical protein
MATTRPNVTVDPCLRYEPDTVSIRGRLYRRTYPGPPNYESVAKGDDPETGFYVHLGSPACFVAGEDSLLDFPQQGVKEVQLNLDSTGYARLRPKLQTVVQLRGTLYAAFSGHHHAPVLLKVIWPTAK